MRNHGPTAGAWDMAGAGDGYDGDGDSYGDGDVTRPARTVDSRVVVFVDARIGRYGRTVRRCEARADQMEIEMGAQWIPGKPLIVWNQGFVRSMV